MKKILTLAQILILLCSVVRSIAQNILIEPSGITPLPTSSVWQETNGNIQYSTGQVIIGSEAGNDRFTVRADNSENPMQVGVNTATFMRIFSNGAISLNGNWNSPISNTTRIAGNLLLEKTIQLGASTSTPNPGTMRWNSTAQDFEGWNGTAWVSLTRGYTSTGSANTGPPTTPMSQGQQTTETGALQFGYDVAIDGEFALVGETGNGFHFYRYDGTEFNFHSSPTPFEGLIEGVGTAVALWGTQALIGQPYRTTGCCDDVGGGYIYNYDSINDIWDLGAILIPSTEDPNGEAGTAVALSENYAILGAPNTEVNGTSNVGKSYIFHKNGVGAWAEQAILSHPDWGQNDQFGTDVAITENYAFVGSQYGDSVYVFKRANTIWGFVQVLSVPETESQSFGHNIAVSGDYLVVGDRFFNNGSTAGGGKAYMFHLDNTGTWVETQEFSPPNPTPYGYFGSDVALAGDYAIIGSSEYNDPGYAVVYHYDGNSWVEIEQLTDPIGQGGGFANADNYGFSVAIDSANWVVGSPRTDTNGNPDQGKVIFGPVE